MKHLKVAFAIVFLCLLGGINSELIAQWNPSKLRVSDGRVPVNNQIKLDTHECEFDVTEFYMQIFIKEPEFVRGSNPRILWRVEFASKAATWGLSNNGNFTVCDKDGIVIWETGTSGRGDAGTTLQLANGNLVLANGDDDPGIEKQQKANSTCIVTHRGKAIWATGTCGGIINCCGTVGPRY